jgi:hypothetical protein
MKLRSATWSRAVIATPVIAEVAAPVAVSG